MFRFFFLLILDAIWWLSIRIIIITEMTTQSRNHKKHNCYGYSDVHSCYTIAWTNHVTLTVNVNCHCVSSNWSYTTFKHTICHHKFQCTNDYVTIFCLLNFAFFLLDFMLLSHMLSVLVCLLMNNMRSAIICRSHNWMTLCIVFNKKYAFSRFT